MQKNLIFSEKVRKTKKREIIEEKIISKNKKKRELTINPLDFS
jgi:hypothetical protein